MAQNRRLLAPDRQVAGAAAAHEPSPAEFKRDSTRRRRGRGRRTRTRTRSNGQKAWQTSVTMKTTTDVGSNTAQHSTAQHSTTERSMARLPPHHLYIKLQYFMDICVPLSLPAAGTLLPAKRKKAKRHSSFLNVSYVCSEPVLAN
jgi:hypothetical protein